MSKRIFAMVMALAMVLSLVPVSVAAGTVTASPKAGTHVAAGHSDECAEHCGSNAAWTAWDGDRTKLAAGGHYYLTADITLSGEVEVSKDLHLCLNGYVLTAATNKRLFSTKGNTAVTVVISDCTAYTQDGKLYAGALTGGNDTSTTGGGALFARREGQICLYSIRLLNNVSQTTGGAILMQAASGSLAGGKVTLTGCYVAENKAVSGTTAKEGGAVRLGDGCILTLKNSTFANNSGSNGGAIRATGGSVVVENSTFTGNSAAKGGVFYTSGKATLTLSGSTLTGNTATTAGSVMYMGGASVKITDSRITGNSSTKKDTGGAVYMGSESCKLTLSGQVYIAENTTANTEDVLLYYAANDVLYVDGLTEGSYVEFAAPKATAPAAADLVVVSGTQESWDPAWLVYKSADGAKYIGRDDTGFIFLDELPEPATHTHCVCGETGCTDHRQVTYQAWDGDVSKLAAGGAYCLTENVTMTAEAVVTGDLDLCLCGYTLTAAANSRHLSAAADSNVTITISDCSAEAGGKLTGGNSSKDGGSVNLAKGNKLYLYDGIFTGNTTAGAGGAMLIAGGAEAYLYGGLIENNTATGNSGAIHTGAGTVLTLDGVTIRNNTTKRYGGAVYVNGTAVLTLSGNTVITGNKRNSTVNNLHLSGSSLMIPKDLGSSANIGITAGERAVTAEVADLSKYFIADGSGYEVAYKDGKLYYQKAFEHVHCECGKADCTDASHKKITYSAWTSTTALPDSGNYCLTKDVTISKEVTLKTDLNLCLCGHKVTGTNAKVRFYSTSGSNKEVLTITDCAATPGGFYNNTNNNTGAAGGAFFIRAGGTLKLYQTVISGCGSVAGGAAIYAKDATISVTNVQITGNKAVNGGTWKNGGAFYLSGSSLTVYSGQFTGNEAVNGAAIYTTGKCSLDIRGGSFTGNITHGSSGAINLSSGSTLKLSGAPVITGNTLASGTAANIYLGSAGVMNVENLDESARIGVTATAFRAISTETRDYTENFRSDNTKIKIVYQNNVLYTDAEGNHKHCLCAGSSAADCDHETTTYIEWDDPTSLPTTGNYYLSVDVTVSAQTTVEKGALNLCLNGHTVKVGEQGGRIYVLTSGAKLNLSDCAGGGKLTGATTSAIRSESDGTGMQINLYGGSITENHARSGGGALEIRGECELNLYGTKITNNSVTSYLVLDADGNPKLSENGDQSFKAANGGAVYLSAGTKFNMYGGEISGNTATEVYYVTASGSKTYDGGKGGAVYAGGIVNLYGGKITGNSGKLGGGVFIVSKGSQLNLMGTELSGNKATNGGAVLSQTSAVIQLKSGKISDNTASGNGGGIYVSTGTTLNMTGGSLSGNTASGNGGGVYLLAGTANLSGGTVESNKAANGAATFLSPSGTRYPTLTISGEVLITGNSTPGAGGAVSATGEGTVVNMTGGTVSKNAAKNGGGIIMQTKSTLNLSGGKITDNTCTSAGAGVYISTKAFIVMTGGSIDGNTSAGDCGGICMLRSTGTFKGGSVSNNVGNNYAGMRISGATVTIHNLTMTGNRAIGKLGADGKRTGGNGGAMFAGQQSYTEGGVKKTVTPKVTIYNIYAANNSANNAGGAMLIQSKNTVFTVYGGTFTGNTAGGSGGAMYLSTNIKATITGGSFFNNSAKSAGAINFLGCDAQVSNVKIYENTVKSSGAAAVVGRETAVVTMKDAEIYNNVSEGAAGAILVQSSANFTAENVKFTGNRAATSGGAMYFANPCFATIRDSEFSGNQSAGIGGAIHVHANADVNMDHVDITGNTAEGEYGGGVSTRGRLVITNAKVLNNTSAGNGGGIGTGRANSLYLADTNGLYATNVIFSGNKATGQGGAVYGHRGGPVYLESCTVTDNTAGGEGSAVYSNGRFSLTDSTVTGNTSDGEGFAVYLTAAEYDGHSYSTGFKKLSGDVIVKDNPGGDMYIGEGTGVAVAGEAIGEKAHIEITLHSGVLSEHLFGVYGYEGGDLHYTVTAGDRSVTDPEEYQNYRKPAEEAEGKAAENDQLLLYIGIAVVILAAAGIALVIWKKKKAGTTANKE